MCVAVLRPRQSMTPSERRSPAQNVRTPLQSAVSLPLRPNTSPAHGGAYVMHGKREESKG